MIDLFVLVDFAGDYTAYKCRQELKNIQAKCKTEESRGVAFQDLCFKFRPVMRHFFYENFASAGLLLERRLAYTRSAAASSIIGYILGLGDRHMQNILIDKSTAELIHIDLGIAFEQVNTPSSDFNFKDFRLLLHASKIDAAIYCILY